MKHSVEYIEHWQEILEDSDHPSFFQLELYKDDMHRWMWENSPYKHLWVNGIHIMMEFSTLDGLQPANEAWT